MHFFRFTGGFARCAGLPPATKLPPFRAQHSSGFQPDKFPFILCKLVELFAERYTSACSLRLMCQKHIRELHEERQHACYQVIASLSRLRPCGLHCGKLSPIPLSENKGADEPAECHDIAVPLYLKAHPAYPAVEEVQFTVAVESAGGFHGIGLHLAVR